MCLLKRINQETNTLRRSLKYNKNFTGVAIAVVASIILGGTILVPIQFGFAAESDNNPRAVKGEGEKATTINNFTNIINNNINCSINQSNEQSATIEQTQSASQNNVNNSSQEESSTGTIGQTASDTAACSPTSDLSSPEESPA